MNTRTWRQRARHWFLRTFVPLPSIDHELDKFYTLDLPQLLGVHIREIIRLVLDEAAKSREYNLFIREEDLEQETLFLLASINAAGGIWYMQKHIPRQEAQRIIISSIWGHFEAPIAYYALRAELDGYVRNSYNCHLENLCYRVIREIYDVPKPAFQST